MILPPAATVIRTMKTHLLSFQTYIGYKITFDIFGGVFYDQFVRYLTFEIPIMRRAQVIRGLKTNTVGKTIKQSKTFIKDRMQRKIIPFIDLNCFKTLEEDVDCVFLDLNELSKIHNLDLQTNPRLIKYRDMFIVGCLRHWFCSIHRNKANPLHDSIWKECLRADLLILSTVISIECWLFLSCEGTQSIGRDSECSVFSFITPTAIPTLARTDAFIAPSIRLLTAAFIFDSTASRHLPLRLVYLICSIFSSTWP